MGASEYVSFDKRGKASGEEVKEPDCLDDGRGRKNGGIRSPGKKG